MNRPHDESDDGRVVADMSGVERRSIILPRMQKKGVRAELMPAEEENTPAYEGDILNKEQRKWYILGTLKASLMIGAVYAIGFFIAIVLMLLIWNH